MRVLVPLVLVASALCGCGDRRPGALPPVVATFSIVAFDPETGDLGVAVQSRVFGVGVVVPWVRADVGAIATQAWANPAWGPDGLELLDDGLDAKAALERLVAGDADRGRRQGGIVDARGEVAVHTGKRALPWAGHRVGKHFCCQGNLLAGKGVVDSMAAAYETTGGPLAERMLAALRAGQVAGGDKRGRQSAALIVARRGGGYDAGNDRYVDLRVDDHAEPIEELGRLLEKRRSDLPVAPVPERFRGLVREPRVSPAAREGARAVWERWKRLRAAGDLRAVWLLCNEDYRERQSLKDLEKAEARADSPQALAARGRYIGTGLEEDLARLFFAVPGRREAVMLLLVRDRKDGSWRIVP